MISEHVDTTLSVKLISYEEAFEQVRGEVVRLLTAAPQPVRGYTEHLAQSSGKLIRASSVLVCAENREGLIHPDAVKFASAIEILHLATLVHDDIIDDAGLRRGVVTLHKKFGRHPAVICGDYLFCLALRQASSVPDRKDYLDFELPDYMGRICLGELRQDQNARNMALSAYSYLRIISGKTAALFEASFYAGAAVCREAADELKKYRRLGRLAGMIFQLTDDCIDYEAPERLAKKPVQSDYEQGVVTLPLIHAFGKRADLREKAAAGKADREEISRAVAETDGLKYTRSVSKRYYDKALRIIGVLDASAAKREQLQSILDKAFRGL